MIDIHSHLLYGVDDGCKTIDESVEILKDLERFGFSDIILTPHYILNSKYTSCKKDNIEKLNNLKKELKRQNIKINLYLGNEIYIDEKIDCLLKDNRVSSLNDSEYLLIELPMSGEYLEYEDIFWELMSNGKKIILAHPERYFSFQKDFGIIYELEKIGVLFQCNIESIVGGYGRSAKKMVKRLFKEKKVTFLASDIHHRKKYDVWEKAIRKIKKYLSDEEYKLLLNNSSVIFKKSS